MTNKKASKDKPVTVEDLLDIIKPLEKIRTPNGVMLEITGVSENEEYWEQIINIDSDSFKDYLVTRSYYDIGKQPNKPVLETAISITKTNANALKMKRLSYRIARSEDGTIYYNLDGKKWVVIDKNGWKIEVKDLKKVFFGKSDDHIDQVEPLSWNEKELGAGIYLLRKYLNISDEDWYLFVVYLVTCFIPEIEHPVFVLSGSKKAGKSTISRILKKLVDPSDPSEELRTLNSIMDNIEVALNNSYFISFDNLSGITQKQSDLFCKVVTGGSSRKRKNYTDLDTVLLKYMAIITLNGIEEFVKRDDLMSRCLFFDVKPVTDEAIAEANKKGLLWDEFNKDKPYILGGIFDLISEALKIVDQVKLDKQNRLSDFHKFGYAIAEAMGEKGKAFDYIFNKNVNTAIDDSKDDNMVVKVFYEFMKDKPRWEGTMLDFYSELTTTNLYFRECESGTRYFSKNVSQLGKDLRKFESILQDLKLSFEIQKSSTKKIKVINESFNSEGEKIEAKEATNENKVEVIEKTPVIGIRQPIITRPIK